MLESRQQRLVGLLVLVVAAAGVYRLWPQTGASAPGVSTGRANGSPLHGSPASGIAAPDVHLRDLEGERPKPGSGDRDLFRFKAKSAPPLDRPPVTLSPTAPIGPPPPPTVPPIALKFIGVVEATARSQKIAVLSDARGVYYGREGEVVEGRYRILRIGAESIEMSYLDGRGRQVIRLSGS